MDGTIEASVKYVREYVHAYLSDVLEDARGKIQTYGQSFNATMVAALQTRQQGLCTPNFTFCQIYLDITDATQHSILTDDCCTAICCRECSWQDPDLWPTVQSYNGGGFADQATRFVLLTLSLVPNGSFSCMDAM